MPKWKTVEAKLKRLARDITFDEVVTLLEHYGYNCDNKGKTSGYRVRFVRDGASDILIHKPHPQKELKKYVIRDIYEMLSQEGFL